MTIRNIRNNRTEISLALGEAVLDIVQKATSCRVKIWRRR